MDNYSYNISSYPESGDSSPRSREIEFENPPPWEDSQPPNYKVKFMCSYGGKIHPRPHDNLLSYIGGETKILSVDRNVKFAALLSKLIGLCDGEGISFKYQLPGEDLDALISVTCDEDLEHMMHEYDRLYRVSPKPARLRIFIFPNRSQNPSLSSSVRSFESEEGKSDKERFVEALNSTPIITAPSQISAGTQPATGTADFLFGLEKSNAIAPPPPAEQPMVVGRVQEVDDPVVFTGTDNKLNGSDPIQKHIQDLQRLRLEEQQQGTNYQRKNDDNLAGGEYYKMSERSSPVTVPSGVPYWTEKQAPTGFYPGSTVSNEQQIYMIPTQASAYHAPMMRQMTGAPSQSYYTVQRIPSSEMYRDQQQMYNVIPQSAVQSMAATQPSLVPQRVTGYTDGYGMMRSAPNSTGVVMTEAGYAQMAHDGGMGRQVIYNTPGGMMGVSPPVQATAVQYQQGGAFNPEAGGKAVAKVTQASV